MDAKLSFDYEQFQKEMEEDCRKQETKQKILAAKRKEKHDIKKGGGGKKLASAILSSDNTRNSDTDFNFGNNSRDDRVSRTEDNGFDSDGCMGPVKCTACGKFHGYCREITEDKEKQKMLPTGDGSTNNSKRRTNGMNWLRIEDLSTTAQEAKILMVKLTEGQYGPQVQLKVAFRGEIRYLGVRPSKKDPRYKTLLDEFGPDENNWIDKRIHLLAEKDEFSEQFNMRVNIPVPEPSASSTTASRGGRR